MSATMSPADSVTLLDRRLEWLRGARPDLASIVDLQGALLRETLVSPRAPLTRSFGLTRERARGKLREGTPLLHAEPVFLDVDYAVDLFDRLLDVVLQRVADEALTRAQSVARALLSDAVVPYQLVEEAFVQHRDHLRELGRVSGADPDVLSNLAALAVRPLLLAYASHLAPYLDAAAPWQKAYCPVCGAWPILAELRGAERQRHLRCLSCGTAWSADSASCSYCENADPNRARVLQVDGERRFRVEVCRHCQGYLKVAIALKPTPPELVGLDDLASIQLDVVATEGGYQRPSTQGYHVELALDESEWTEDVLSIE